ncbi:hypothetical protein [Roseibium album]|uniref:hypothetical protein n=1 Tax=Roseibium album TaxID=311410 RepID=UPI002493226F|nr:hypothetical protein [Roseibium album]
MKQRHTYLVDLDLQLAVEDVVRTARDDGMKNMPEMICYNIAKHEDFTLLTPSQAERFVLVMKGLIGVNHVQEELHP